MDWSQTEINRWTIYCNFHSLWKSLCFSIGRCFVTDSRFLHNHALGFPHFKLWVIQRGVSAFSRSDFSITTHLVCFAEDPLPLRVLRAAKRLKTEGSQDPLVEIRVLRADMTLSRFFSKLLSAPIESWTITWPMGLCGNEITVLHSPQRQAGGKLHKWEASNWSRLQPLEKVGLVECRAVVLLCTLTSWDLAKDVCQRLLICCDECCRKVWRQMTLEKVQVGAVRMLRCSTPLESMKNAGMSELHPPLQVLPACSLCVSSCLCSLLPPPFPRWGSYSIPSCTHGNCPFPRCHQPWAGFHRLRIN